jgi:uncharacterized protein
LQIGQMLIFATLILHLSADIAGAVPPPESQNTANCTTPVYASDTLVCEDAELSIIDRRLTLAIASSVPAASSPLALMEPNEAWFKRSRLCAFKEAHRACLVTAYNERLAVLAAAASLSPRLSATCAAFAGNPVGKYDVVISNEGLALWRENVLFAVATQPLENVWQPYLMYRRSGNSFRFSGLDGRVFKCHLDHRA